MPIGPPTWSRTIGVSGKARARSTSSPSWVKYIQASKLRPSGCSLAKPSRTFGVHQEPGRAVDRGAARRLVGMRGGDVADAAEAAAAGQDHRLQHLLDLRRRASDRRRRRCRRRPWSCRKVPLAAIAATPLANSTSPTGRSCDRAAGAVHRQPFEIDRRDDVVAAAGVGEQFGQQIAAGIGAIDQVMVRVDDRQVGFEDFLLPLAPAIPGGPADAAVGAVAGSDGIGELRCNRFALVLQATNRRCRRNPRARAMRTQSACTGAISRTAVFMDSGFRRCARPRNDIGATPRRRVAARASGSGCTSSSSHGPGKRPRPTLSREKMW